MKQRDPLTPSLFLLVAEGLNCLIKRAYDLSLFSDFQVGPSLKVSHLQYVDDTLILVDPSIKNLWSIKAILIDLELASDLRVNFHKSNLIVINVDPSFLELTEGFLHCKIESLPFRYLILFVGASPRSFATLEHLVNMISKRLRS